MTNELKFERETCSRCGGSGRYSYCEMHGDTCFKCGGIGQALTKRAAIARRWMQDQRKILGRDIKVGMRIRGLGWTFDVVSCEQDTGSTAKSLIDGVWIDSPPYINVRGQKANICIFPNTEVELIPSKSEQIEQLRAAIEYQNGLTKAGKPRKSEPQAIAA